MTPSSPVSSPRGLIHREVKRDKGEAHVTESKWAVMLLLEWDSPSVMLIIHISEKITAFLSGPKPMTFIILRSSV